MARLEPEDFGTVGAPEGQEPQVLVILDFVLEETEAKEVNLALDMVRASTEEQASRGQALVHLARFCLARCKPEQVA